MVVAGGYQDWYIGLALSFAVIVVVVIIVAFILTRAARIADQAGSAIVGVDVVRAQTTSLDGGVARSIGARAMASAARAIIRGWPT